MLNLRHLLIVCLALSLTLTACATDAPRSTPTQILPTQTSQSNNTFTLTAEQAQEVAVFIEFIHAYNSGQMQAALAFLAENVSVSDCDYQNMTVVTFQGKSQAAEWLQERILDHDQLEVSHIYNENLDPSSSRHVIGVIYSRRKSTTLANLGLAPGITPGLDSKVIFTSEPTLIQSFANVPYGGDLELCRAGN